MLSAACVMEGTSYVMVLACVGRVLRVAECEVSSSTVMTTSRACPWLAAAQSCCLIATTQASKAFHSSVAQLACLWFCLLEEAISLAVQVVFANSWYTSTRLVLSIGTSSSRLLLCLLCF